MNGARGDNVTSRSENDRACESLDSGVRCVTTATARTQVITQRRLEQSGPGVSVMIARGARGHRAAWNQFGASESPRKTLKIEGNPDARCMRAANPEGRSHYWVDGQAQSGLLRAHGQWGSQLSNRTPKVWLAEEVEHALCVGCSVPKRTPAGGVRA